MGLTRDEQAALVTRIQRGDEAAFVCLRDALNPSVYGSIRVRANNDADSEDITQETWLKLWRNKFASYDPTRGSVLAYVKAIALNILIDMYRQRPSENPFPVVLDEELELGDLLSRLKPGMLIHPAEAMSGLLEDLCLRLVLGGSSPPHQLLAFGFARLLDWKPQEIVAELSAIILRTLEQHLESEYVATRKLRLSSETIRQRFKPLRDKMQLLVGAVITEVKTRIACESVLDLVVGDTMLKQYYKGGDSEIPQWCGAVINRTKRDVARMLEAKDSLRIGCDKQIMGA